MMAPTQYAQYTATEADSTADTSSLMTEPTRASARFSPSARASSLPWKYDATNADCTTDSDSPPRPNTVRPIHMVHHAVPSFSMLAPSEVIT